MVAGLTLVAFGVRWACVHQSLFGDELIFWNIVHHRPLHDVVSVVRETEKTPPLGFVLSWVTARGGDAASLVRLPSVLAGVATVPLLVALGRRTIGGAAGLVAAAWFALSPFEIFYGTESRSYALATGFVVLSTLSLLTALDTGRRRQWALYVVAATGAVYSHYISALVLIPLAAWALWTHRPRWREQLLAHGLVVAAFAAWIPSFLVQARHSGAEANRIAGLSPFTFGNVMEVAAKPLIGHPYAGFQRIPGAVPLVALGVLLAGLLIARAVFRNQRAPAHALTKPRRSSRGVLLALLAVAPAAIVIAYSAQPHRSFLLSRNASVGVPFALLLIGGVLTGFRRRIAVTASAAALAAVAVGAVQMVQPEFQRPDTRGAARFVDARATPRADVVDGLLSTNLTPYLRLPHRFYSPSAFGAARWAAAVRARRPIVLVFPNFEVLERSLDKPLPLAPSYRLMARQVSPGVPAGIDARVYVPRPADAGVP
jgi:hypothetical protein